MALQAGISLCTGQRLAAEHLMDVLEKAFSTFNVHDTVPNDYNARFMTTGDIVVIDDKKKGKCYYQLFPAGWKRSERLMTMS